MKTRIIQDDPEPNDVEPSSEKPEGRHQRTIDLSTRRRVASRRRPDSNRGVSTGSEPSGLDATEGPR